MTLSGQPALQNAEELAEFVALLRREGVSRFLEIGSRYGDTLFEIGMALPPGSRIVSIDLPTRKPGKPDPEEALARAVLRLTAENRPSHAVIADSRSQTAIRWAQGFGPYDCVFIDGDHSLEAVAADFENYAPMARLVAFHDINPKEPKPGKRRIEVPEFWQRVKRGRPNVEIKRQLAGGGIGVVWMR